MIELIAGPYAVFIAFAKDYARCLLWQVYYREPTNEEINEELGW